MPTTDRINGSDVLIIVGGDVVALQKGLSRSSSRATIDLSAKGDDTDIVRPGRRGVDTLSLSGLWSPDEGGYQTLLAAHRAKENVVVQIALDGDPFEEADMFITQMDEDWPEEGGSTFSATLSLEGDWREPTPA